MSYERSKEIANSINLNDFIKAFEDFAKKCQQAKESETLKNDTFAKAEIQFIADDVKRMIQYLKKKKDEI